MRITDTHIHLDNNFNNPKQALKFLLTELKKINVKNFFLIHMDDSKWDYIQFSKACDKYQNILKVININPNERMSEEKFLKAIKIYNFKALKLHPRLYKFNLKSKKVYKILDIARQYDITVIIDAFPDGDSLLQNIKSVDYAFLAKKYNNINFIWAHMGGYQLLDFLMLAKRLNNVFLDFSYTLLYFQDSSVEKDLFFAFKSLKYNRVMFGSDYPDRSISLTNTMIKKLLKKYKISKTNQDKIMYLNAQKFFE